MATTKKVFAPFGSSQKRFGRAAVHPGLDPSGLYSARPLGCDPCLYRPKPIGCLRVTSNEPWKSKKELEAWAKNLGYRCQRILDYNKWHRSILGPAWCEPKALPQYRPACDNVLFGRTPRWKTSAAACPPPPGTYYKPVPFKASHPHSHLPTFEHGQPCRFKDTTSAWSLAPNRYRIVDKDSIEQKPNKVVSLKGPYELLTGPRDESTIKNHFSQTPCPARTWPLALPGSFEHLKKTRLGTMNKTSRGVAYHGRLALTDIVMCHKEPEPGPASYSLDKGRVFRQHRHGFNSSYDRGPGYVRCVVWPAVGRYSLRSRDCGPCCGPPGHGHGHVFRSRVPRTIGAVLPQPMNTF